MSEDKDFEQIEASLSVLSVLAEDDSSEISDLTGMTIEVSDISVSVIGAFYTYEDMKKALGESYPKSRSIKSLSSPTIRMKAKKSSIRSTLRSSEAAYRGAAMTDTRRFLLIKPDVIVAEPFFRLVAARIFAENGRRVLVLEKRTHLGGNAYDEKDAENGAYRSSVPGRTFSIPITVRF